ncbi:hypothetical protein HYH02_009931 [Chlamydomonas schloesseri]|uniref:Uncharacterized protein n=1 Tax=Chlamydomonas schloesseri TaxID=2026947 RepID=A0A835T9Z6_9CHLO|nr:hypothetical protein HYH02_009931 [Chlamydomonas schloesseri]|eukprot:KAG2441338.1 hypothetical protein HYH02_009931 [Chlamydomonas schloesseri]
MARIVCSTHGGSGYESAAATASGVAGEAGALGPGQAWSLCADCGGVRMQPGCGCGCSSCSCNRRHRERRNGMLSLRQRRNGLLSLRRRRNGMMETGSGTSPGAAAGAGGVAGGNNNGDGYLEAPGVVTVRTWHVLDMPASAPASPADDDASPQHPGCMGHVGYPGSAGARPATATPLSAASASASALVRCGCACSGCCCASGDGVQLLPGCPGAAASAEPSRPPPPQLAPTHAQMRAASAGIRGRAEARPAALRVMSRSSSYTPSHRADERFHPCTCLRRAGQAAAPGEGQGSDTEAPGAGAGGAAACTPATLLTAAAAAAADEAGLLMTSRSVDTAGVGSGAAPGPAGGQSGGGGRGPAGPSTGAAVDESDYGRSGEEAAWGVGSIPSPRLGVAPGLGPMMTHVPAALLEAAPAGPLPTPPLPLSLQPHQPPAPYSQQQHHQSPLNRRLSSGLAPTGRLGSDEARAAVLTAPAAPAPAPALAAAVAAPAPAPAAVVTALPTAATDQGHLAPRHALAGAASAGSGFRSSAEAGSAAAALLAPPLAWRCQPSGPDSGGGGPGLFGEPPGSGSRPTSAAARRHDGLMQALPPPSPQPPPQPPQQWAAASEAGVAERPVPRKALSLRALMHGSADPRPVSAPSAEEANAALSQWSPVQRAAYAYGSHPHQQQLLQRPQQPQTHNGQQAGGGAAAPVTRQSLPVSLAAAAVGRAAAWLLADAGPSPRQPGAGTNTITTTVGAGTAAGPGTGTGMAMSSRPQLQRSASSLAALGPGSSARPQSLPNPEPLSSTPFGTQHLHHHHLRPPQRSGGGNPEGVLLLPPLTSGGSGTGAGAAQHHAAVVGLLPAGDAGPAACVSVARGAWTVAQQPLSGPAVSGGGSGGACVRRASTLSVATPVLSDVEDGSEGEGEEEEEGSVAEGGTAPALRLQQAAWRRARQAADVAAAGPQPNSVSGSSGGGGAASGGGRLSRTHTASEAQGGRFSRVQDTLAHGDATAGSGMHGPEEQASAEELSPSGSGGGGGGGGGGPGSGRGPAHSGTGSGAASGTSFGPALLARRQQLFAAIPPPGSTGAALSSGGGSPAGGGGGGGGGAAARLVSPPGSVGASPSGAAAVSHTAQTLTLPRIVAPPSSAASMGLGAGPGPGGR